MRYDATNRVLTVALVALLASAVLTWRHRGGRALATIVVGCGLALLDNLLEFWVLWGSCGSTDASAERVGSGQPRP